jgi:hypothetical protein
MAAKLTTLIHKIAIQLHLVAESCIVCSSGGQSGEFWIHPRIFVSKERSPVMLMLSGNAVLHLGADDYVGHTNTQPATAVVQHNSYTVGRCGILAMLQLHSLMHTLRRISVPLCPLYKWTFPQM